MTPCRRSVSSQQDKTRAVVISDPLNPLILNKLPTDERKIIMGVDERN